MFLVACAAIVAWAALGPRYHFASRLDPTDEHSGGRHRPIMAAALGSAGVAVVAGLLVRYIGRARR